MTREQFMSFIYEATCVVTVIGIVSLIYIIITSFIEDFIYVINFIRQTIHGGENNIIVSGEFDSIEDIINALQGVEDDKSKHDIDR